MVRFSPANGKLSKLQKRLRLAQSPWLSGRRKVYSFDLLAGWTCPQAKDCKSKVHEYTKDNGKRGLTVIDGKNCEFRCFMASAAARSNACYDLHKANTEAIQACTSAADMAELIESALPVDCGVVRIHASGDFFNTKYLRAWLAVIKRNPDILFYCYTKSNGLFVGLELPDNFSVTFSRGGRQDHLITEHGLRESVVVYSHAQAAELGLEIDSDDSHAALPEYRGQSFALLIHGVQPKGSEAGKAVYALRKAAQLSA